MRRKHDIVSEAVTGYLRRRNWSLGWNWWRNGRLAMIGLSWLLRFLIERSEEVKIRQMIDEKLLSYIVERGEGDKLKRCHVDGQKG